MKPPTNILWICADDLTVEACPCYGNSIVNTPHIDRIANSGLVFDRAYCNAPLSTPARQSFWTGRYPRSIGVTLTPTALPMDEITLPELLKQNGYVTASCGKTHYYSPRKQSFDFCVDHSEYKEWLENQGIRIPIETNERILGSWRPGYDSAAVWLNGECLPFGAHDHQMADTFYTDQASAFLDNHGQEPFFLYLSLGANHSPFRFPLEFSNRIAPSSIPLPLVDEQEREAIPLIFRELADAEKRGIIAAYFTATEFLDKNVGLMLDALQRSPFADNTLVIFTSDHGYALGQHGRFEKHAMYEETIRAALLMSWPGKIPSGSRTSSLVELQDLASTLLELCNVPIPKNMQSKSILNLLQDPRLEHRQEVFLEHAESAEAAIRTQRFKLVFQAGGRNRRDGYTTGQPSEMNVKLFDLEEDPREVVNLSTSPAHTLIRDGLIERLLTHLRETDRFPELIPDGDIWKTLSHCVLPTEERF